MTAQEKIKQKYDTQEFANFDYLCHVVSCVPDRSGTYTYGSQYLQLFTEPIPRKFWPGKPIGAPIGLVNLNQYGNFNGLTVSLPGDGWMSGGWVGLIITMGLVGALLGRAHRWFWQHSNNNLVALFYLVSLAMLPQWFRDGGISIAKFLLWSWLPLLLWLGFTWLLGRRQVPGYSVFLPGDTRIRLINGK
jgi:oligosaccharide repeat unit polymerase